MRKYDTAGNELWTRQFGTAAVDDAEAVSADASGVYVAGGTQGTLLGEISAGGFDAFVRKFDADGNELWTDQSGTSGYDVVTGVSSDSARVYLAGSTGGVLPGETFAGGFSDAFVRTYDAGGFPVWTDQFGTAGGDAALMVSVDASGAYVAGSTEGTLGQSSAGGFDVFLRRYEATEAPVWTIQFGTAGTDQAGGVSVDASGVYVAGVTDGTLPGTTSSGGFDAFLVKFG